MDPSIFIDHKNSCDQTKFLANFLELLEKLNPDTVTFVQDNIQVLIDWCRQTTKYCLSGDYMECRYAMDGLYTIIQQKVNDVSQQKILWQEIDSFS